MAGDSYGQDGKGSVLEECKLDSGRSNLHLVHLAYSQIIRFIALVLIMALRFT